MSQQQHPFPNPEAFAQIDAMIRDLMKATQNLIDQTYSIADEEASHFEEESPERTAWQGFGSMGIFSDAGRVGTTIQDYLMSLCGSLIARGLDPRIPKQSDAS